MERNDLSGGFTEYVVGDGSPEIADVLSSEAARAMRESLRVRHAQEQALSDQLCDVVWREIGNYRERFGCYPSRSGKRFDQVIDIVRVDRHAFDAVRRAWSPGTPVMHTAEGGWTVFDIPIEVGPDGCGIQLLHELQHYG